MDNKATGASPSTAGPSPEDRLDSWKEIAAYLRREVRTVQRWEKSAGLPVHRLQIDKHGTVYAYKSELDAWYKDRQPTIERDVGHVSANEVCLKLSVRQLRGIQHTSTASPDAQNEYLKGRYYSIQENTVALHLAISIFEKSIAMAPGFAPPCGNCGSACPLGALVGCPARAIFPESKSCRLEGPGSR